jgi:poly [ADP-ribose] polymerase
LSCKGVGLSIPDPSQSEKLGKVTVPLGKIVDNLKLNESELLYNEFIVYNTEQIRMKYLIKVKFHFK